MYISSCLFKFYNFVLSYIVLGCSISNDHFKIAFCLKLLGFCYNNIFLATNIVSYFYITDQKGTTLAYHTTILLYPWSGIRRLQNFSSWSNIVSIQWPQLSGYKCTPTFLQLHFIPCCHYPFVIFMLLKSFCSTCYWSSNRMFTC